MDRAIKEIVTGIVQRSVSIATQTTKELVLKVDISVKSNFLLLGFANLFIVLPNLVFVAVDMTQIL